MSRDPFRPAASDITGALYDQTALAGSTFHSFSNVVVSGATSGIMVVAGITESSNGTIVGNGCTPIQRLPGTIATFGAAYMPKAIIPSAILDLPGLLGSEYRSISRQLPINRPCHDHDNAGRASIML